MKPKIIFCEDTVNGACLCRKLAEPVIDNLCEANGRENTFIIYWESPGYARGHIFNDKPKYGKPIKSCCDYKCINLLKHKTSTIKRLNNEYSEAISRHTGNQVHQEFSNVAKLFALKYREIRIGPGIAQWLYRVSPMLYKEWCLDNSTYAYYLANVKSVLDVLYSISVDIEVQCIFLSDPCYIANCIIKWCKANNTLVPWLEAVNYDCMMPDTSCNLLCGISEFGAYQAKLLAIMKEKPKNNISIEMKKELTMQMYESRVRGLNIHSPNWNAQKKAMQFSSNSLTRCLLESGMKPLKLMNSTLELIDGDHNTIIIIFYLHCFADAPFAEGFSGFAGTYEFYCKVAKVISMVSGNIPIRLLLRPHPFVGAQTCLFTDKEHMNDMEVSDIILTAHLIMDLQQICLKSNNIALEQISPGLPLSELCKTQNKLVHITHHGTVAEELLYLNQHTVTTVTNPIASRNLGCYVINTPEEAFNTITRCLLNAVNKKPPSINRDLLLNYGYANHIEKRLCNDAWGSVCNIVAENDIPGHSVEENNINDSFKSRIGRILFRMSPLKERIRENQELA